MVNDTLVPLGPAHAFDGIAQIIRGGAVHTDDAIAGLDSGIIGRRSLNGGYYRNQVVFHGDMNADAGKLSLVVYLQLFERFRCVKIGVGIEAGDHPPRSRFQ